MQKKFGQGKVENQLMKELELNPDIFKDDMKVPSVSEKPSIAPVQTVDDEDDQEEEKKEDTLPEKKQPTEISIWTADHIKLSDPRIDDAI